MTLSEGLPVPSTGFARDGWLHDRAELQFPNLASFGNSLSIEFQPSRPGGPAELDVFLCGISKGRWIIGSGTQVLKLNGDCYPQTVSFSIVNPIQVHAEDPRQLGAEVKSISVASRLGAPLPTFSVLFIKAGIFFSIAVSVYIGFSSLVAGTLSVPLTGYVYATYLNAPFVLHALWMVTIGLFCGVGAGRRILKDRKRIFRTAFDTAPSLNIYSVLLLTAVIVGGILRFGPISFGLPEHFHPDEIPKAQVIVRMYESGSFNPGYFLHPSLLLYLSYGTSLVLHYFGVDEFYQTTFLAGRLVSAAAGTISIALVYFVGRALYSQSAGALAALLLSVFPLHVTSSRYMKEDSLLLCMMLLCLVVVLRAVRSGRSRDLLFAGLCAGLCASSKYSGAIAFIFVASAPWLRSRSVGPDPKLFTALPFAAFAAGCGFVAGTPFSVLDTPAFLKGLSFEKAHMLKGHTESITAGSQAWMYHWGRSLIPGVSAITAGVGAFSIGLLLYRRRIEDLFLIGCFLLFYLPAEWVRAKPAPQPERYIFPCLPFFALLIAEGLRVLWYDGRRITALLILGLCLFFPLKRSVELYSELTPDTRTVSAKWIEENIPAGSKIVLDFAPYSPHIDPDKYQLINNPLLPIGNWLDIAKLREAGAQYIILSSLSYDRFFSQPSQPAAMRIRLRRVAALPLTQEFKPKQGTYGFHNPTIRIYSIAP